MIYAYDECTLWSAMAKLMKQAKSAIKFRNHDMSDDELTRQTRMLLAKVICGL
jgi:hypothetical protein